MKKTSMAAALVAAVLSFDVTAEDARGVIDRATGAMGTASLQSLQYSGTGSNYIVGQAETPGGPWPRFTVKKYAALLNYAIPLMRQDIVRVDDSRPPRGGGAGPFNPATGQGGIRPIPGDIVQNQTADGRTEVGSLNIWLTPHGFLKGAAANLASARLVTVRGGKATVSFTAHGKYTVAGTIDDRGLVERVETHVDNTFFGDMTLEGIYSEYKDFGGIKIPMHVVQRQGGHPVLDIVVADAQPNAAAASEVKPQQSGAAPAPAGGTAPIRIETERIAAGVAFLNFASPQSILVEFADYVVIIEAPLNDERSTATIAEVKRLAPHKPIRYLINTHHHADHAGGLRAYVAEGIPVITHEMQARYYEQQIFRSPRTIVPDLLARTPRAARIEAVKDRRVLTDGRMTLELHHLRGNLHSEGLLVAYVPTAKLLIQADAFAPRPGAAPLPAPSPYTINLVENVERLKLEVERVAHVHGGVDNYAAVFKAAGR